MNNPLAMLTDQFLKERTYLKNVTPATLVWYRVAFKSYRASFANDTAPLPTKAALQDFVVKQREHGLRPVTVNTYIGAMNAFCVWLFTEGHIAERVKLPKLRVERRMLSVLMTRRCGRSSAISRRPSANGAFTSAHSWPSTQVFASPSCYICGTPMWISTT